MTEISLFSPSGLFREEAEEGVPVFPAIISSLLAPKFAPNPFLPGRRGRCVAICGGGGGTPAAAAAAAAAAGGRCRIPRQKRNNPRPKDSFPLHTLQKHTFLQNEFVSPNLFVTVLYKSFLFVCYNN